MTLYRQMMIMMTFIVILLLTMTMFVNYKNAENFIRDQLYSNATNTASSLGIAIGRVEGERIMSETMINAVFDSGYYESIILYDMDNNIIYESRTTIKVKGVPSWFIKYIQLDAQEASVPISSNWRLVGYLKINGHLGHAYEELWVAFSEMLIGFSILGILSLIGIYILLKIVLLPLYRVRRQAEAVMQRRFILQEKLPKTREMRDVVNAMNLLVLKVKTIYKKEAQAIADYKKLLYEDRETGYYNRDYFRIKLEEYLHSNDYFSYGYVVAFELHNYPKLLEEKGSNGVHQTIIKLRDAINQHNSTAFVEEIYCRTRENDIMVILPASRKEDVEKFAYSVCEESLGDYEIDCAYISYEEGESLSHILERMDSALMISASLETDGVRLFYDEKNDIPVLSHDEWVEKILHAIKSKAFIPMLQPVIGEDKKVLHNELLLRLRYKERIISAGLFMPIMRSVNMLATLDRYVLETLTMLQHIQQPLAVNITHDFISHSANLQVISSLSKSWKEHKMEILFELPNITIASDIDACKTFAAHLQRNGCSLGIDHFTIGAYDLQLLEELKPSYLKINAAYLLSLIEGKAQEISKYSLFTLTTLLEIDLIAIAVDSEDIAKRLSDNNIIYMQGFWISEPKAEEKL